MISTEAPQSCDTKYTRTNTKREEDLGRLYAELGWSILPIRKGTKKPAERGWKDRQTSRASLVEILDWIRAGHGLGIVLGSVSDNWICRDFDDTDAYQRWAAEHFSLAESLPTARTKRGYHVFVRSDRPIKITKFDDGELRGDGSYVLIAPSIHPDGAVYRWVTDPSDLLPLSVADTGLDRAWTDGVAAPVRPLTCGTETTETTEAMSCVISVVSVPPDQHEQVMDAIDETVPGGVGGRNDGIFQFARKLLGILGGQPTEKIIQRYACLWYDKAKSTIGTLDPGVTVADLTHAIRNARKPDTGQPFLASVMEDALAMEQPAFVAHLPEDCPSVRLAKLVVSLSQASPDGVFFLGCRDAAKHAGYATHTQANKMLNHWVSNGILKIVQHGKRGPAGSKATRYRLIAAPKRRQ